MKNLIIICSALLLLTCCKKKDNRQYSYWYVNTDSFSTNDVRIDKGHFNLDFSTNNTTNGFSFSFNIGVLPIDGSLKLDCTQQNPEWVCFGIIYHNNGYYPNNNSYIRASENNGKARYVLEPMWLYNSSNTTDSIFVHGTFNEP